MIKYKNLKINFQLNNIFIKSNINFINIIYDYTLSYEKNEIWISYNGGKDSTVIFHLINLYYYKTYKILPVYINDYKFLNCF